jgi:hypothetical protein
MPPAFNLSQDQTLQFDLECFAQNGIEVNFTSTSMSVCGLATKNQPITRLTHGTRPQTPTLIGCMFLKNRLPARCRCVNSEALKYDLGFRRCQLV